jgi:hypothetical protein
MIARMWFGRTKAEDYDAYLAILEESGAVELKQTRGNQGVMVVRRLAGDSTATRRSSASSRCTMCDHSSQTPRSTTAPRPKRKSSLEPGS